MDGHKRPTVLPTCAPWPPPLALSPCTNTSVCFLDASAAQCWNPDPSLKGNGKKKSLVQTRIVALKSFCLTNRNASTVTLKKMGSLDHSLEIFYTQISPHTRRYFSLMLLVIFPVNKGSCSCFASLPRSLWGSHACPPASVGQMAEPFLWAAS